MPDDSHHTPEDPRSWLPMLDANPELPDAQARHLAALLGEADLAFWLGRRVVEVVDGLPVVMTRERLRLHAQQVASFVIRDRAGIRPAQPKPVVLRIILDRPNRLPHCPVVPPLEWLHEPGPEVRFLRGICGPVRRGFVAGARHAKVFAIRRMRRFGMEDALFYRREPDDAYYERSGGMPSEAVLVSDLLTKGGAK